MFNTYRMSLVSYISKLNQQSRGKNYHFSNSWNRHQYGSYMTDFTFCRKLDVVRNFHGYTTSYCFSINNQLNGKIT